MNQGEVFNVSGVRLMLPLLHIKRVIYALPAVRTHGANKLHFKDLHPCLWIGSMARPASSMRTSSWKERRGHRFNHAEKLALGDGERLVCVFQMGKAICVRGVKSVDVKVVGYVAVASLVRRLGNTISMTWWCDRRRGVSTRKLGREECVAQNGYAMDTLSKKKKKSREKSKPSSH